MKEKPFLNIQKEVDDWANQFEKPYFSPLSRMAALTEEVGEVARVMNRMYGDKPAKGSENLKDLEEELGDVLFSLVCTANAKGINLDDAFDRKMDKVTKRDISRWEKKNND